MPLKSEEIRVWGEELKYASPVCMIEKHIAVGLLEIKHVEGEKKSLGKGAEFQTIFI